MGSPQGAQSNLPAPLPEAAKSSSPRVRSSEVLFNLERLPAVWLEAQPLMLAHHQEVGQLETSEFEPDYARYEALDQGGSLKLFTMRENSPSKLLVGYCLFHVCRHLHYPKVFSAVQDVLYVDPDHRGFKAAKFIAWQDEVLEELGAKFISRHVTNRCDYSSVLEGFGYKAVERTFMRRVS